MKKETSASNHSYERYCYVRAGERVIKSSRQPTKTDIRQQKVHYLTGLELRTTRNSSQVTESLRVITLKGVRILHWQRRQSTEFHQQRFSLADRNESIQSELDGDGNMISREHYYPFGGTSVWATNSQITSYYKTLRYSARERDMSGLLYYRYRYYAPWRMCWINPDPAGAVDGLNLFRMVKNNPITFTDEDGRAPVNLDDIRRMGQTAQEWFNRAISPARQGGSAERNQAMLRTFLPAAGFLAEGVSNYFRAHKEIDEEFLAFRQLAHNLLPEVDPITDEKYQLRNITVIGKADKERPAITYTMKGRDKTLFFSSHGNHSRDGEPIINGEPLSAEHFHNAMKSHHADFDSGYDLLVLTCCSSPEGAKKYGNELRSKMKKNILIYSGKYAFREEDPTGLLKDANKQLYSGQFPMIVSRYVKNEEKNGRVVHRKRHSDKSKFLFLGSNTKVRGSTRTIN